MGADVNSGVVPWDSGPKHPKLWAPTWWWRARRQQNPLCRRWSPTERLAASLVGLVALVGIAAIAFAMAVVNLAGKTRSQQETQARHQVTATVLDMSADVTTDASVLGAVPASYSERLSWTWRNRAHVGEQTSVTALPAGTTTTVWVDDAGELATTPWSTGDTSLAVVTVGVAGIVGTVLLTMLGWLLFDRWLSQRRAELWQVEWEHVAPIWSGHTRP
jgi:hypothetical protein